MKCTRRWFLVVVGLVLTVILTAVCSGALAIKAASTDKILQWLDNAREHPYQHGGGNCTDFVNDYLIEVWNTSGITGLDARYWPCPEGFKEVNVGKDADLLKVGDIIQEDYDPWGHVCVFYGKQGDKYMVVDQATGIYATPQFHQWWGVFENPTKIYRGPTDLVKPKVSNAKVSNVSSEGYTVTCNVSDNEGIDRVAFPTWTEQNGQDDIKWMDGTVKNGVATFNVKVSDHNNERGCKYITHIYVYDTSNNSVTAGVSADVPMKKSERLIQDGDYLIVPTAKQSMFLDINGIDKPAKNGEKVTLYPRDASPQACDIWTVSYKDGYYTIKQMGTNMCLDVEENNGSQTAVGTKVQVWQSTGAANQQWIISKSGQGYRLQARCSGLSLDIANAKFESNVIIRQWSNNDTNAQSWTFLPYSKGKVKDNYTPIPNPTATPKPTAQPAPQKTAQPMTTINISITDDGRQDFIGETSAQFGYIRVTTSGNINDIKVIGCEIRDREDNLLSSHEEATWVQGNEIVHYFRINNNPNDSDIYYSLTPGTNYRFQVYVIYDGKKYYRYYQDFTTKGIAPTAVPVVTKTPEPTAAPTPVPVKEEPRFAFVDDGKQYFMGDTTAQFGYIRVTGNVNINDIKVIGCELADGAENILAAHEESTWIQGNEIVHYFRINGIPNESDIFYTLTPGTTYKFRTYVIYEGVKYYSEWRSFTTNGSIETPVPTEVATSEPTLIPTEVPMAEVVTVNPAMMFSHTGNNSEGTGSNTTDEQVTSTEQVEYMPEQEATIIPTEEPTAEPIIIVTEAPINTAMDVPGQIEDPQSTPFASYPAFTNIKNVNVRAKPKADAKKVVRLDQPGTTVTIVEETYDKKGALWYKVKLSDGNSGYIRGDLLTTNPAAMETIAPELGQSAPVPTEYAQNETVNYAPSQSDSGSTASTNTKKINVRKSPRSDSKKVDRIDETGTTVTTYEQVTDNSGISWTHILTRQGVEGYVQSKYLDFAGAQVNLVTSLTDAMRGSFTTYSVQFVRSMDFDVYSGPGTQYVRGANGRAYMSSNEPAYVYGSENGYLLVQYHVSDNQWRFGYVSDSLIASGYVPPLEFSYTPANMGNGTIITDDPLHSGVYIGEVSEGAAVTVMGYLDDWAYIEYGDVRGFVRTSCLK